MKLIARRRIYIMKEYINLLNEILVRIAHQSIRKLLFPIFCHIYCQSIPDGSTFCCIRWKVYQSSHGSTPNFASFTSCYMYKLSQHAIDLHFCYLCYFSMVMLLSILGLPPIIEVLIQQKISFQDQGSWKGVKNNWSMNFQIQSSK